MLFYSKWKEAHASLCFAIVRFHFDQFDDGHNSNMWLQVKLTRTAKVNESKYSSESMYVVRIEKRQTIHSNNSTVTWQSLDINTRTHLYVEKGIYSSKSLIPSQSSTTAGGSATMVVWCVDTSFANKLIGNWCIYFDTLVWAVYLLTYDIICISRIVTPSLSLSLIHTSIYLSLLWSIQFSELRVKQRM